MARVREGLLWVPLFEDLLDNAKTWKLAAFIKADEIRAAGHLVALWLWAIRKRPSGIFEPDEGMIISKAMRWAGDAEAMAVSMRDIGWLDVVKGGKTGSRLELHDWPSYVGLLRSVQAARKQADAPPMPERSAETGGHSPPTVDRRQETVDRERGEARSPLLQAFRNRRVHGTDSQLRDACASIIARYGGDEAKACEASVFLKLDGLDVFDALKLFKPNGNGSGAVNMPSKKSAAQLACKRCDGTGMRPTVMVNPITKAENSAVIPCTHEAP